MSVVEIRDHSLWPKHIHGNEPLKRKLLGIPEGTLIELEVDGFRGIWKKMSSGKDGLPMPGIRAIGPAREHWHGLQTRRGDLVSIKEAAAESAGQQSVAESFAPRGTAAFQNYAIDDGQTSKDKKMTKTTRPGYINRNGQTVIRKTNLPGNDHMQFTYVLQCGKCQTQYGANGSDIWQRRCPRCGDGAKGLPISE